MIEDLPLISINVKILKFWSFILVHNWKRYLCFTATILLHISQFVDMYYMTESLAFIIRNTYFLVLWFNTIGRAIFLTYNHKKFERFMENMEVLINEIKQSEDMEINKLLDETTKNARRLTKFNLFLGILVSFGFMLYPLFSNSRVLPFGSTIPGINKYESPYYEIIYAYQLLVTPIGCCMYIPFTSLIVTFIMFGVVMEKVLQYRLRNLKQPGDTDKRLSQKIVWCVEYHEKIIGYVKELDELTAYLSLTEFITFGATLCALLFLLNIVIKSFMQACIVVAYMLMIFTQIYATYWNANELYQESLNIAEAAYDTPWFEYSRSVQKSLLLIIGRAQIPLALRVGDFAPMTLQVFQSLLKASYTYFTLLRKFYG